MTDSMMQQRVMAQLRSYPPGARRTAAQIAAGMSDRTDPRTVEATLKLFYTHPDQQMVQRWQQRGSPDLWGLI